MSLWSRHRHTVSRYDLSLIRENFAGAGVDENFYPVNVVVVARGVSLKSIVAKGFNASKVFEPTSFGIEERLVHPEVVRIAMNVSNRLFIGDHFRAQCCQELLETVRLTVGFRERLGVTHRSARGV